MNRQWLRFAAKADATLADANERHDWRLYAEFAQRLITRSRALFATESVGVDLDHTVYALDATTHRPVLVDVPVGRIPLDKGAVKLHTLLALRGAIPSFIHISDGKLHEVNVLDLLLPDAGAFHIMDRAYLDFARLYALDRAGSFLVTRAKSNMSARRLYSMAVDGSTGLICDQTIALANFYAAKNYPAHLRRIRHRDPDTDKSLVFLTDHSLLPALTIGLLYKSRWQEESFFKRIKQHLRIKHFYGTSENAVKTRDPDRRRRVCAGGDHQEGAELQGVAAYAATDSLADAVRKSLAAADACRNRNRPDEPPVS